MKKRKPKVFSQKMDLYFIFALSFFIFFIFSEKVKAEEESIIIISEGGSEEIISKEDEKTVFLNEDGEQQNISEVKIGSVKLQDVKVISQQDNHLKVSFEVINQSSWIQPNVKYGVFLVKEENADDIFSNSIAKKIYDEELNLDRADKLKREIDYSAPAYLKGKYLLVVEIRLSSGFFLKAQKADELVALNGDDQQFLELVSSSCYLSYLDGNKEQTQKRFGVLEEAMIDSYEDKLIGTCQVINHANKKIIFTPEFKIYSRSIFENKVQSSDLELGKFKFDPYEIKNIFFPLPIHLDPQIYDVEVFLKGQEGNVSNSVLMRYVIKGASATIQNFAFNKVSYLKGEEAKVAFSWDGQNSQSLNSNMEYKETKDFVIDVLIKNQIDNKICGKINSKLDLETPNSYLSIPIEKDCDKPVFVSTIKSSGEILDQRESQPPLKSKNVFLKSNKIIAISILSTCLIIFLFFFFIKRRTMAR